MTPLDLLLFCLAVVPALVAVALLANVVTVSILRERERITTYGVTDKGQPAREERIR